MFAVVPAAGLGTRMGELTQERAKVLLNIGDNSILSLTLTTLLRSGVISGLVLVAKGSEIANLRHQSKEVFQKQGKADLPLYVIEGGETRQESVLRGLSYLESNNIGSSSDLVLVHDAVRPFCPPELIQEVCARAKETAAAILALPVKATLKRVAEGEICQTVSREDLWEAQTPQVFRRDWLLEAHRKTQAEGFKATDDAQLLEYLGKKVSVVRGSELNLKITTPQDMQLGFLIAANFAL